VLNLRVTRAAVDIGAALATARQRKLLGLGDPAAVLRVERTVFTTGDRPLHFEASTYRPEAFSYRLELAR
jgi:DNA-binding GntR family transcriptional regulator